MHAVLDHCFGEKEKITLEDFKHITEHTTSDMVLAVLSIFRERLPCSENYWRYKCNYEIHMQINNKGEDEEQKEPMEKPRQIAQSHMSFVRGLTPYNSSNNGGDGLKLGQ